MGYQQGQYPQTSHQLQPPGTQQGMYQPQPPYMQPPQQPQPFQQTFGTAMKNLSAVEMQMQDELEQLAKQQVPSSPPAPVCYRASYSWRTRSWFWVRPGAA
jgi:hypothetical protein